MNTKNYILETKYDWDLRYICPKCGGDRKFVRYINSETKKGLAPEVGKCRDESNCGYNFTPSQYFNENPGLLSLQDDKMVKATQLVPETKEKPFSVIPIGTVKKSLDDYETNSLVIYLSNLFGVEITKVIVDRYMIGSSDYCKGSTIFWQIDINGKIRTGKIIKYNFITGHIFDNSDTEITWVHSVLRIKKYNLEECFFGEHLLRTFPDIPVAIVENEKTALIASVYLPQYIWIAVGSFSDLSVDKCQVLKGRRITLFPELNGYHKCKQKAKELSKIAWVNVSDLLEQKATFWEREDGLDLADYLVRFSLKEFIAKIADNNINTLPSTRERIMKQRIKNYKRAAYTAINNSRIKELAELELFFKLATLLDKPVNPDYCTIVSETTNLIDAQFAFFKAHDGMPANVFYLIKFKKINEFLSGNSEMPQQ